MKNEFVKFLFKTWIYKHYNNFKAWSEAKIIIF